MIDLVAVELSDYEALAGFLADFEQETRPRDFWRQRFQLWWDRNPARQDPLPRGWVIKDEARIVGFLGCIPFAYQLAGQPQMGCSATTWRVLAEYRLVSIKLILNQMDAWKDGILFFSTPSDRVRDILTRLKFAFLRTSSSGRMSVVVNRPFLNPVLAYFTRGSEIQKVKDLAAADASFDGLWARTRGRYRNTCVRDAAAVNWFCFAGGETLRKKLFAYYEDDRLVGYTVFYRRAWPGRSVFEQLDLWIEPTSGTEYDRIATALLAKAKSYAETSRYGFLLLRHFDPIYQSLLKRRGVYLWKTENWGHYYRCPSQPLRADETHFSCMEGDFAL